MTKAECIQKIQSIFTPVKEYPKIPKEIRSEIGRLMHEGKQAGLTVDEVAKAIGKPVTTVGEMRQYYEKKVLTQGTGEQLPAVQPEEVPERPTKVIKPAVKTSKPIIKPDVQPSKRKLTVYVSEANYKTLRYIGVDTDKELSELINEGIELLQKRYK